MPQVFLASRFIMPSDRHGRRRRWTSFLVAMYFFFAAQPARALIEGGTGNNPIDVPGWPVGAAVVFNAKERIAYWVGPPFGGGEWHGEFRGDTDAFNRALVDFARIDAKVKQLVVHNGVGQSFWLNVNRQKEKEEAAKTDWVFVVWDRESWLRLRDLPARLRPDGGEAGEVAPPRIDVYADGNIDWARVKIPEGIEVVDERLEAHGFRPEDGTVLEGTVVDLLSQRPLASEMQLQLVAPQAEGGYKYTTVATATADKNGRWVLKSAPSGWHRVVLTADGYAPRVVGFATFDGQPHWSQFNTGLARPATVAGRVMDADGKPLADADVRIGDVVAVPGGRYEPLAEDAIKTDRDGRFVAEGLPVGRATLWVYKAGFCRPGLGLEIETPADNVSLTMVRSATIEVTIDFSDVVRPEGYLVEIEDARGAAVGRWGGTANIDADGKVRFQDVPPGRYVLTGRPNPGGERETTDPIPVDLAGGEEWTATLKAK